MRFTSVRMENPVMRKFLLFKFSLLFVVVVFSQNSFAQDFHQLNLPEGAKARLGKGRITGNIAYSPDGRLLAVASGIGVWLYDAGTGAEVKFLTGHTRKVTVVAFSPDGSLLASGSLDDTIRFWNVYTGEQLRVIKPGAFTSPVPFIKFLVFSPDGSTLAHGDHLVIRLWDVQTGKELGYAVGHFNTGVFSPDGSTLVLTEVYEFQNILVWNLSPKTLSELKGHTEDVFSMAFLPTAQRLPAGAQTRRFGCGMREPANIGIHF